MNKILDRIKKTAVHFLGWMKKHYYLSTALLMFLSFPSFDCAVFKAFPLFAWISLVPLFAAVRSMNYRELYAKSFLTFLAGSLFTWGWMGSFGGDVAGGYIIIWILLLPCIALFLAARIIAAEFLSRRYETFRILIYPAVWLLVDLIQSIGYLAFPWTYWGYSQYPVLPLMQASSVIGVLGVTFLIIAGNTLIAYILYANRDKIKKRDFRILSYSRISIAAVFAGIIAAVCLAGGLRLAKGFSDNGGTYKVAMIQSCISPWDDWSRTRFGKLFELTELSDKAMKENPDLLIWSESATLEAISYHYRWKRLNEFESRVLDFVKTTGKPLITGEIGVAEDYIRNMGFPQNNAVLISESGEVVKTYSKINLCPFGEWFPYEKVFPWVKEIALQMGGSSFVPGKRPELFTVDGNRFGILICYEGMFPRLNRYYKNNGAQFLINITNDGWSSTYAGHYQHFAAARFRAVENGIWYLRAGNTGFTAVIDPMGSITASIPFLTKGYLVSDIRPDNTIKTVYSVIGDLFSYCIILLCVILCATNEMIYFYRKRKGKTV